MALGGTIPDIKELVDFNPIVGQKVNKTKLELSRKFRKRMTSQEKILWEQLRDHRLLNLHFRRQQIIRGFIADFYCHRVKLVIEVDGGIHKKQLDYDRERDRIFSSLGLRILRIKNKMFSDIDVVLQVIEKTCIAYDPTLALPGAERVTQTQENN